MAARLLCKSGKRTVFVFQSSLKAFAQQFGTGPEVKATAAFSSNAKWGLNPPGRTTDEGTSDETNSSTVWPDPNLGLLGPRDKRLPLPGNVGFGSDLVKQSGAKNSIPPLLPFKKGIPSDVDLLTYDLSEDRHAAVLDHFLRDKTDDYLEEIEEDSDSEMMSALTSGTLECVAQECPQLIRKDFSDLFPEVDIVDGPLTVVTLSQRTENDMCAWNEDIELEREELMLYFVIAAEEICAHLTNLGYWADFIDPTSGRPYLGPYTNSTMFETDERYRNLGFVIEDLGCCKVICHPTWGSHVFTGCIFTNAPANDHQMRRVIARHNSKQI